ncbi:MAG: outer membrane protein transport protein [Pseudomonadota bacterium]
MKQKLASAAALLFLACGSALAQPQDGPPQNRVSPDSFGAPAVGSLPIDVLPPGARALGLAGAFTAVADDATAAEANPAGLTILSQPEVSLHVRNSDYSLRFVDLEALDSTTFGGPSGELIKTFDDSSTNVSFASYVKPFDRWTFSAFYGNQLDLTAATPSESVFDPNFIDTFVSDNALAAEIDGFGLSAAFRLTDTVSVGLTVKRTELDLFSSDRYTVEDFNDLEFIFGDPDIGIGSFQDFADVIDDVGTVESLLDGDDSDTVFNLGVLVNPNGRWSFGAVYKQGAEFSIPGFASVNRSVTCPGTDNLSLFCQAVFDLVDPQVIADLNSSGIEAQTQSVVIPDRLTLGLALRPSDTLLISLDLNLIEYEDLPDPRPFGLGGLAPEEFRPVVAAEQISNEINYHVGVEKVFPLSGNGLLDVFTLRGGVFEENDFDGFRVLDSSERHYTFGLGAVLRNLQIDLAYESSDDVDNIVLSGIYRFD